jgi:hypothetical protein
MLSSQWAFVKTVQIIHKFMNITQLNLNVFAQ